MSRKHNTLRRIFNGLVTALLVATVAFVVMIFVARLTGNTPSVFGYRVFRVLTDSMTPTLEVGDVILVRDCEPEEIHNGDIITYNGEVGSYRGKSITHRVVEEPEVRDGVYYYWTKGDRQGAMIDPEISFYQVEGKYVRTIPYIDKLYTFFLSPAGLISFIGLIVVLFGYELVSLLWTYKTADAKDDDYYAPKNKKPKAKRKK